MVWGLFPIDALRGAHKYYIFSPGTYKVGRKDCDVVVQTDTAVSRLHAEIIVDKMASSHPSSSGSVRIIDRSKYGTWTNKELGAEAVRVSKDEHATLKDGDTVTFGTGNATFRFAFVPLTIFVHGSRPSRVNRALQDTMASIGAYFTSNWSPECTHVLVDQSSPMTNDLIDAVTAKKPLILSDWLKVLAEKNIRTEFPCFTSYTPILNIEGTPVKIVEPKLRDRCLEGYTFLLGTVHKYKFRDKFQLLLQLAGARFLGVDEFCSGSQTATGGGSNLEVLVIPDESPNEFDHLRKLSSLSTVTDVKLIVAILSGHLESSIIQPPSIIVTSSHSTDETIVADSDVEIDTATSDHVVDSVGPPDAMQSEYEGKDAKKFDDTNDVRKHESIEKNGAYPNMSSNVINIPSTKDENSYTIKKIEKTDVSHTGEHRQSDIIYSQDLIVRDFSQPLPARPTPKNVVNFKCFRKTETVSGNSFKDLVPFSKDPFKEYDYGSETATYMREEKKRKQMEAISEDLFNNEKARKRATAGTSIQAFLTRR